MSLKQKQPFRRCQPFFPESGTRGLQLQGVWRMALQVSSLLLVYLLVEPMEGQASPPLDLRHVAKTFLQCLPVLPHQVAMFCRPRIQLRLPPGLSLTELQQGSIQKGTVNVRPKAMSPLYSSPTPARLHSFIHSSIY